MNSSPKPIPDISVYYLRAGTGIGDVAGSDTLNFEQLLLVDRPREAKKPQSRAMIFRRLSHRNGPAVVAPL